VTLEERMGDKTESPVVLPQQSIDNEADRAWQFWFTLPIYPYSKRRTIRTEVVPDTIWTFEQVQGILCVVVPIRMTVVKLRGGGLLVYAPVAPTLECIELVNELVAIHGDVKYIILPTISGLEHKVFVGPFARQFAHSQVWVTPDQWSFPVNLPLSWLGLPVGRTQILPADSSQTPFSDEFDYAILKTIDLGPGQFAEVAFFHPRSRTLLVTDSIVSIPLEPPAIVQSDPLPLLFHAKDIASDIPTDTPTQRRKGWQRICLFALYFQPSVLEILQWGEAISAAFTSADRSPQNYFGLYPFRWRAGWEKSFEDLHGDGRLFVAPILQNLILNRAPQSTIDWANRIAQWDFYQIIPCHFDAPIVADSQQFRSAFNFLEYPHPHPAKLPESDLQLMQKIERILERWKIITPAQKL
jgi:hypothetical protein